MTVWRSLILISLIPLLSCEADNTHDNPPSKELSACTDFYRYECSSSKPMGSQKLVLKEFNQMLDAEVELLPGNSNQMFDNLKIKLPTLGREEFRSQLTKKCGDENFVKDYFRAAIEDIGEASSIGQPSCSEMVNTIVEIVLDDQREAIEDIVDVIKKVRDLIAFEKLRNKDSRINEAFRLTREFFENIRRNYLEFINSTSADLSKDSMEWYTRAARVELELLMRTHKFFVTENLDVVTKEYFNCSTKWIMGIDNREKAFCLSRAWRIATGTIPMPTRLAQFLHDLRSLNVNILNDRIYVRPAYALLLLNTTDDSLLFGTLGTEIAREITRASLDVPLTTRRCFQEQMKELKCNKDVISEFVKNYQDIAVFTLSIRRSNNTNEVSIEPPTRNLTFETAQATTTEYGKCHFIESDLIYNIVALRALYPALEKLQEVNKEKLQAFFSYSSLLDCRDTKPLTISQINTAFLQSSHFQRAFGCKGTDPMYLSKDKICKLL